MMPSIKRIACFFSLFLISQIMLAQETIISNGGSYTGCGAIILDSGGNPGDYSPGEYIEYTICPEAPETIITLDFLIFSLAENDFMNIYQGPDVASPLDGTYMGFDLSGQVITTSGDNVSGCLTILFASDLGETGNFGFAVSCGPPCDRPEAIIDAGGPNPILICVDEELTFDGNPSVYADGASLGSYNWTFGDGSSDNSSGMVVTHSYSEPGEYRVQLFLVDDNDCNSINLPDVQVLVGTVPSFEDSDENIDICLGQEVDINGNVIGTLWNGQPENPIGGYLEIPDDQTQCFSSEIIFSNFLPGQTVSAASDFESIFVNMEHSYMGDLIISLICPDGSSIDMHQQGGGGTFLGVPNDPDIGMEIQPGVGFDYFWAPDATNGTWAAESIGVPTLPSGTYSSVQPFDGLIGCPMNGIWTLEICDLFGADNGVVFDWTVNFDPSLYPEITQFTPIYGAGCDSTSWAGPYITSTAPDCNIITVLPTETGTFQYTYTATDNHGCTYEHTATVNVEQGPLVEIDDEVLYFCGNPITLGASLSNPSPGSNYNYEWSPSTGLSNPNSANPTLNSLSSGQWFTVFVYEAGEEVCGSVDSVFVDLIPPVFSQQTAVICANETFTLPTGIEVFEGGVYVDTIPTVISGCDSIITTNLTVNPVYEAEVSAGLCGNESLELPNGEEVTEPGSYVVILQTTDGCDSTITFNVTVVTVDAGEYAPSCTGQFITLLNGSSDPPANDATLTWSGPDEVSFDDINNPNTMLTAEGGGAYTIELTDSRCPDDPATALIILREPPQGTFNELPQICFGENPTLQLELTGDYSLPIVWTDVEGFYFDEEGSTITITTSDYTELLPEVIYTINATIPGLSPCLPAFASTEITIINCDIEIPNIFTPNGDGINETFAIPGIEYFPGSKMVIFNRWGKKVYESDSYGVPYWNGTNFNSGDEVADGVYYYELILSRFDRVEKGTITLLRNR